MITSLAAACTRAGPAAASSGWRLNSRPLPDNTPVTLPASISELTVTLTLPDGYELAEGYQRHLSISGPTGNEEIVLSAPGEPTTVPVPEGETLTLTLSIGFCRIQAKDVCYVSVTELVLHRTDSADTAVALSYRPEVPD